MLIFNLPSKYLSILFIAWALKLVCGRFWMVRDYSSDTLLKN